MSGEVVVVGSGPNGLSAAVAMAREGFHVTVLEMADSIGGGTRTEELTLPGFAHDVCSSVHPLAAGSPFFRQLHLEEHGLEWVEPPVAMAHPFDDGTAATLVRSVDETAETLGKDAEAYRALVGPLAERWRDVLDEALAPPVHLPRHPLLLARLGLHGLRSALGLAEAKLQTDRARAFFVGISAHTLLSMQKAPSAAFGLVLAVTGHGAGWPFARGGSRAIAGALGSILSSLGGRVETGVEVTSLAELPKAEAAFLDVTPRQLLRIAGGRLPIRYRRRLERYRYGPGIFKVDWALAEPIPWRADACRRAGTVHIGGSTEEVVRSADAAWNGHHDEEPALILVQPSLFDDTRAPAGRHTAWAYCHVPNGSTRDMTESIERQVERFAPGFRDVVLARHTMNTAQLEARNPNLVGGDINGGAQDMHQLVARPVPTLDPYRTPLEGIYLCSASTPPGGAVHGMCGYHAASSALEERRLGRVAR